MTVVEWPSRSETTFISTPASSARLAFVCLQPVAVNCSALDLLDRRLPQEVTRLLLEHDVPPELLRLELTETMVMTDPQRATDVLQQLHAMGVGLAIDDFGTGYSSLAYLRQLPLDELKIDRAFVARINDDPADTFIVSSMIDLGHNLGLTVVAEGIEDQATIEELRRLGCDVALGYHVSRPLQADRLEEWLAPSMTSGRQPAARVARPPARERRLPCLR